MTANFAKGSQLGPVARADALARYVHRMTVENQVERPAVVQFQLDRGYRLRLLTDAEWLACTSFAVRADGGLDNRNKWCTTSHPDYRPFTVTLPQ
jgi:hypothetical protein